MPRESAPKKENHKLGLEDLKKAIEEKKNKETASSEVRVDDSIKEVQKKSRSVEDMATDLVSASLQGEKVKDWVEEEKKWAETTRKKWIERNTPINYTRFDGKNVRYKQDIPYEDYVHNYNQKKETIPLNQTQEPLAHLSRMTNKEIAEAILKNEIARAEVEKLPDDRVQAIKNFYSTRQKLEKVGDTTDNPQENFPHLGHNDEEFKQLEQEAQRKFHRMKSYESRKGHPEYDVAKQQWQEARDEVIQYENTKKNNLKEKETPVYKLTTEEKSEKFKSVGALQRKEVEKENSDEPSPVYYFDKAKESDFDVPPQQEDQKKNPSDVLDAPNTSPENKKDVYEKASREYESLKTKNTDFVTDSMLLRAKRERDKAKRAYKGDAMEKEEKEKQPIITPISKPNKLQEWFKKNKRKAATLGAGLMAAFLVNNEPRNESRDTIDPESSPIEINSETPKGINELGENKKSEKKFFTERIRKTDGYTQVLKRVFDAHPDFMEKAGIPDTSPESMKKIGERIKVIDQKTGEEIRLDASVIGGILKIGINKKGELLMVSNLNNNNLMEKSIFRYEGSDYELRQVPGEYRTGKDGTRLVDDSTADPFGAQEK